MVAKKTGTLFFDLDGTLADTSEDISTALNSTLEEFGLPHIPHDVVMSYVGDGVRPLIRKALEKLGRLDEEEKVLDAFLKKYEEGIARKTRLYDGVIDIIFFLKTKGMEVILLTNKLEHLTIHLLRELEVLHIFDGIVGGDTFPCKKPSPELLEFIKEKFLVNPPFFILGDGKNDFLFAKNTGITFIFAEWGFSSEEEVFREEKEVFGEEGEVFGDTKNVFKVSSPYDISANFDIIFRTSS